MASGVDPDQTPRSVVSDQDLHCFLRSVCSNTYSVTSLGNTFFAWRFILNAKVHLWLTISNQKPFGFSVTLHCLQIQSTLVISKSKGLSEILRDIRSSTYQISSIEEKNKSNNYISHMNM